MYLKFIESENQFRILLRVKKTQITDVLDPLRDQIFKSLE